MDGLSHVLVGNQSLGFAVVDKTGGVWCPIHHQTGCLPIAIVVAGLNACGLNAFASINGTDHLDIRSLAKFPNTDDLGYWRNRTVEMQRLAEPLFRAQGIEVAFELGQPL